MTTCGLIAPTPTDDFLRSWGNREDAPRHLCKEFMVRKLPQWGNMRWNFWVAWGWSISKYLFVVLAPEWKSRVKWLKWMSSKLRTLSQSLKYTSSIRTESSPLVFSRGMLEGFISPRDSVRIIEKGPDYMRSYVFPCWWFIRNEHELVHLLNLAPSSMWMMFHHG